MRTLAINKISISTMFVLLWCCCVPGDAKIPERKRQPYDEQAADQQTATPLDSTPTLSSHHQDRSPDMSRRVHYDRALIAECCSFHCSNIRQLHSRDCAASAQSKRRAMWAFFNERPNANEIAAGQLRLSL
jgi:hypothetical protein